MFCLIGKQLPQRFHGVVAVVLVEFDWTVQATHVIHGRPFSKKNRWQFEAFVNTADLLYILRSDLCNKVFNENLGKTDDLLMTYKAMQRMILNSRIMRKWWEKEQRFTKTTKGREWEMKL